MNRIPFFLIPAITAIAAVSAAAQQGMAPFQIAESGQTFTRLADAIEAVGDRQPRL